MRKCSKSTLRQWDTAEELLFLTRDAKAPDIIDTRGESSHTGKHSKNRFPNILVFSHPDYTVGSGFSPDQLRQQLTDFPARCGCALHPPARHAGITVGRESTVIIDRITLPRRIPILIYFIVFVVQASLSLLPAAHILIVCTMPASVNRHLKPSVQSHSDSSFQSLTFWLHSLIRSASS